MSGWVIIAVVAIVVWGIVELAKARAGITVDAEGNETYSRPDISEDDRARAEAEASETRAEIEQLRERLQVLERIATDGNSSDARERARISAEIEALRAPDDTAPSLSKEDDNK